MARGELGTAIANIKQHGTISAMGILVIGNWKMNPGSRKDALKLIKLFNAACAKNKNISAVIAPPFPYLSLVTPKKQLKLCAQSFDVEMPLTGGISIPMLKDLKVSYVIVGHSERRAHGETDTQIGVKVTVATQDALKVVVCVGEKERDHSGKYFGTVEAQVLAALKNVTRSQLVNIVIAYEPIWAISSGDGRGETATPDTAHEMKLFIQKVLVGKYGRAAALRVPIIYGGSVNPENASALLGGEVDGFLVGGASIKADAFISILKTAAAYGKK